MERLATDQICKLFKGRAVVNGVSISIARGEVVGLLGPNGAGKTTTFHMIVGQIAPDMGRILLDQHDITALPMYQRAQLGISYLPQEPSVFRKLTVEQNLLAILEILPLSAGQRKERLEKLIEMLGLGKVRRTLAYSLSGGERRRVEIARGMVLEPAFMLLDEPFSGIDPLAVLDLQHIISRLRADHIGVLITDHNVRETLSVTDRAYIIHDGRIFREGTPAELGEDADVRRVYLGESFSLV
ncbi:MAG: LPS export ABC transporter ATP-binding protein [Acidobacteria bacterium]|nr:MAG: LPS export ABC transporter ATP-binding protein [Acidobacteriota bacterium]